MAALEARQALIERDGLQGAAAAGGGVTIVGGSMVAGAVGSKDKAGGAGSNREGDLMLALQLLLDKLNSGNLPLSQDMWDKMQRGEAAGTNRQINITGIGAGKQMTSSQGEMMRRHNGERMQLERDVASEESEALDNLLQEEDAKRKRITDQLADSLSAKLQGDLKESEIKEILTQHEKDLQAALDQHNKSKDKQMDELRKKLQERRKAREGQLREKHSTEAESVGLPKPIEGADDSELKLKTEQNLLNAIHNEQTAATALAEMDADYSIGEQMRQKMVANMKDQIDSVKSQDMISDDVAIQLLKKQQDLEDQMQNKFKKQREDQLKRLRENMEKKKQQKLRALQQQQEQERAELSQKLTQDGHLEDKEHMLKALDMQHKHQKEALVAQLESEENEQGRQMSKALDDDHTMALKDAHRKLSKELLESTPQNDRLAAQRILDQYQRDLESLDRDMQSEKNKRMSDIQAKLAAKRERRRRDGARNMEDLVAQRVVEEQARQIQGLSSNTDGQYVDPDLHHMPTISYVETNKEQAMKKDQERALEDIKKRHQAERDQLVAKLDSEAQKQEHEYNKNMDNQMEQALREKKSRHAAELAARKDMSQEELAALMASHARDVDELAQRMENEKARQQLAIRDQLAEKRRRRMEELRRRQDAELMGEMLEQRKELDDVRVEQAKSMEKKAIEDGIRENGQEVSDKVVQAVLAQRHAQELRDLENEFVTRKKVIVDDAMGQLNQKYDKLRDEMAKRHAHELAALEKSSLSPEEKQERRSELLNKHQMEQAKLERQLSEEEKDIERGSLKDWEVEFARAKLALKEKHYKEFAEALRNFDPDNDAVKSSEDAAGELERVRAELDKQRKAKEEELRREQDAFEKSEAKRLDAEMAAFAQSLELETEQEKAKYERNIEALNKRKDDLVKEKKQKLKEELDQIQANGGSKAEKEQMIKEHEKAVNQIVSKMEADRLRMQSNLQDKLKKKKGDKMKDHEADVKTNLDDQKREMESSQRNERDRMLTNEILRINETLNEDSLITQTKAQPVAASMESSQPVTKGSDQSDKAMPSAFSNAAPLNEAELINLLMASPLYKKLEDMKNTVANGNFKSAPGVSNGEGFVDDKESQWDGDKELKPVDLNTLNARSFVVYKFGCFVVDLISRRCNHPPITMLLAETVPANPQLSKNCYRNSFSFDANNRILYLRQARLDSVGEFCLILSHCLAHIKSGDLRDDTNPEFVREYQRALTVLCDDMFLSKIQRPEQEDKPPVHVDPATASQMLQALFAGSPSEDAKTQMMEELLGVKLRPNTIRDGAKLTKERVAERLAKHSNFSALNKLQDMLGDTEDKVHQAKSQGSNKGAQERLAALSTKFSTAKPPASDDSPLAFVMANMTGNALYQTFENSLDQEQPQSHTVDTMDNTQDKIDTLSSDFAQVSQNLVKNADQSRRLEEELTSQMELLDKAKGKEQDSLKGKIQAIQKQLGSLKDEGVKLNMEKSRINNLLKDLQQFPDQPLTLNNSAQSAKQTKPQKKSTK